MSRQRIMPIFGTRPEAIKMAPVVQALCADPCFETTVVVTAQHRGLLDDVLGVFGLVPAIDLDLMRPGQSPTAVAARVLLALEPLLDQQRPDWVLVQGDTTTVMAAALAAHYAGVRVGHVEAGLRSFDRRNPFPEEANRVVTGHLSDLHFAPTPRARDNLVCEGIDPRHVLVTGNTVVDALRWVAAQPWRPAADDPLAGLPEGKRWILVTAHRRESFGEPLADICIALERLAERGDVHLIYPVHPNPRVHGPVHARLGDHPAVTLLPPLTYRPLVWLLARAALVLTDSGGIQEEAPALGKPVLVLRETTERPEAIEAGLAELVGTDPARIVAAAERLLDDPETYAAMARVESIYGDGRAAERIVRALRDGGP